MSSGKGLSFGKKEKIDKTNNFKTHVNMYNLAVRDLYTNISEALV